MAWAQLRHKNMFACYRGVIKVEQDMVVTCEICQIRMKEYFNRETDLVACKAKICQGGGLLA